MKSVRYCSKVAQSTLLSCSFGLIWSDKLTLIHLLLIWKNHVCCTYEESITEQANNFTAFIALMREYWRRFRRWLGCPALFYLLVTLPSGILMIAFDKRRSWPDYQDHWHRVLQIVNGHFLAQPNPDGSGGYGGLDSNGVFQVFNNTAINSPLVYFPGVLGCGHQRLAALFTLIICALTIAVGVRISGLYYPAFLGIGLLPIVFTSICWPTADAVTNAFSIVFVAYVVHLLQQTGPLKQRSLRVLCCMSILLGFIKITCAVLVLLVWLLPLSRKGKDKAKTMWSAAALSTACTIFALLTWMSLTSRIPPSAIIDQHGFNLAKKRIFQHPLLMIRSLVVSFIQPINTTGDSHDIERNVQLFTGIGPDALLPAGVMVPVLIICCLMIIKGCAGMHHGGRIGIAITVLIVLAFFALTGAGLESSWGSHSLGKYIGGLQSRYYIPIYAVLVLIMPNFGIRFDNPKLLKKVAAIFVVWSYIGMLLAHCLPFQ